MKGEAFIFATIIITNLANARSYHDSNYHEAATTATDNIQNGNYWIEKGISSTSYGLLVNSVNSLERKVSVLFDSQNSLKKCQEEVKCRSGFSLVGGSCLLLELSQKTTWSKAREYCREREADLAIFKDANAYHAAIQFVKSINSAEQGVHVWIGATDNAHENYWVWVDGTPMPRASPFWGSTDGYKIEPGGGTGQNCAIMYQKDNYYIHDLQCDAVGAWASAPLCQYFP